MKLVLKLIARIAERENKSDREGEIFSFLYCSSKKCYILIV